ncbi:ATP-binding protein, partial [Pontibacter sp. HJ8]
MKGNYDALLKDVIAMANSDIRGSRRIILGVKLRPDGTRDIIGIEDLVDDGTYQQIISDNVEPQLIIKYYPFSFEFKKVGILEIHNADDPPYMMKKSYNQSEKQRSLKEGDSWIRVGSSQKPITRKNIDRYIKSAVDKYVDDKYISGKIEVLLTNVVTGNNILKAEQLSEIPSELAANKIRDIIKKKESLPAPDKLPDNP